MDIDKHSEHVRGYWRSLRTHTENAIDSAPSALDWLVKSSKVGGWFLWGQITWALDVVGEALMAVASTLSGGVRSLYVFFRLLTLLAFLSLAAGCFYGAQNFGLKAVDIWADADKSVMAVPIALLALVLAIMGLNILVWLVPRKARRR